MRIRTIISRRSEALRKCKPKQRDKLRHELRVAMVAAILKRRGKAA